MAEAPPEHEPPTGARRPSLPPPASPTEARLDASIEHAAMMERLIDSLGRLGAAVDEARPAEDLLSLATALAEAILDRELATSRETLLRAIEEGLNAIGPERPVRVRLSPRDHDYVAAGSPDFPERGIKLIEDARLEPGRVLLENETRALDASVATQLERFVAAVRESLAENGRPSVVMRLIGTGDR
jgi:flagellar biosynthesis/type III secretory pathway protein FliH